jgi:hypothetical protein
LTTKLAPYLKITIAGGLNVSSVFNGKTTDASYIGFASKFDL